MLDVSAFKVCCRCAYDSKFSKLERKDLQNVNVFYFNGIVFYYLCIFFDSELP